MGQLTEELSQSSNIKSPSTRKNVQGALRKISQFLKSIDFKIPARGIVVFAGNVSPVEGRSDLRLFTIHPPKDLKTKLYWCDSQFHLEPLKDMVKSTDIYAIIVLDKREATVAVLTGKKFDIVGHFTSMVAGKSRAGGQCLSSDTLIPLPDGDIIEMKDTHNPLGVLSGDFEKSSIIPSAVTDKWETEKTPLKIVTKYPRFEIQSSKDHTFFVLENGKVIEKKAENLKVKDRLLFPEKITIFGKYQPLQTQFFNSYQISKAGRELLIAKRLEKKWGQTQFGKRIGITQTGVSIVERAKSNIRHDLLIQYLLALEIPFESFVYTYCTPLQNHRLPPILDIPLAQFIGYWIGDGNTEKERVCLSEQDPQLSNYYAEHAKKLFNANVQVKHRKEKGYFETRIYGKPIVKFLQSEFPEKHGALESEIPKKVLRSPDNVVAAFLKGIFDAEGYVSDRGLGLGINNKKLAKQLQLALLRFGIITSVHPYDNRRNPYSKNIRYTLQTRETRSLELFQKQIGFSSEAKNKKLNAHIQKGNTRSVVRQIPTPGSEVRKIIEKNGWKKQRFISSNMYLQDRRNISKQAFERTILAKTKTNPTLYQEIEKIAEQELMPVEIFRITGSDTPISMVDISVQNQNFVAGGLIVHNSSVRFEHLREEAAKDFFKKVSEKTNQIFSDYQDKLKGLIIGGPGRTKHEFLERELLDYRLKEKIMGILDCSYTDESGIREIVQKSEDLLKDAEITHERQIVNEFFEKIVKGDLATYGQKEVENALDIGKASILLISEALEWIVLKKRCDKEDFDEEIIIKDPLNFDESKERCSKCGGPIEILEQVDYVDWMMEKTKSIGAETRVISRETPEGETFFKGFGGIGAILRYK